LPEEEEPQPPRVSEAIRTAQTGWRESIRRF
jgi:hypothetical protein